MNPTGTKKDILLSEAFFAPDKSKNKDQMEEKADERLSVNPTWIDTIASDPPEFFLTQ